EVSRVLSRFYCERFGFVLHHNVDKALLRGGAARPAFGGGEVLQPIDFYLAGRATTDYKGVTVPVAELAVEACRGWLRRNLRTLDAERHFRVHCLIRPGSVDLAELFERQRRTGVALANDTSCGVGFAPLSQLETIALSVERRLNAAAVKQMRPAIGEDIKVMGVRRGAQLGLTVASAAVGRHLAGMEDYLANKAWIAETARAVAGETTDRPVAVEVNTADGPSPDSIYLTVTGTSAEAGDDGEAGRGNRVNGLITPYRPMTMESAAGKNPISHVGKLYNIAAGLIAETVVAEVPEAAAAECYLVSRIGQPIDEPQIAEVRLWPRAPRPAAFFTPAVEPIVRRRLVELRELWRDILSGAVGLDRWPLRQTIEP
ncbi:MAG TPA: methionine adenosyltransferase, partial [Dongiaceae bacterium]|nr:methionine adenosyltransferase [Dongiaceae bacterium]